MMKFRRKVKTRRFTIIEMGVGVVVLIFLSTRILDENEIIK